MQVPYFVPEVNYMPGMDAKCKRDEVHVFRVDLTQEASIREGPAAVAGKITETERLTRITTSAGGATWPQFGVSFATGWRYFGVINFTASSVEHGVSLRFYRPGYETIAVKSGDDVRELRWTPATDLSAQVKAVDDLLHGPSGLTGSRRVAVEQVLESGAKSASQREALLFAAGEYERLARELAASTMPEERNLQRELRDQAGRVRALAEGKQ
jgi:hypothetical protein